MARPERNNVDYFPFYCEEGNKMFYIEQTYGNDGFATFVKLLRELAKTDYHYLNLSKQNTLMYLSAKCKVTKETLELIINDLVEIGKFDSVLWNENKIIWCQDFINSIQDAYKKRNNKCITFEGLLTLLESLGIRKPVKKPSTGSGNPQSKVKDTILNNNIDVIDFVKLLDFFNKTTGKKSRTIHDTVKKNILKRLEEGYTKHDIMNAIKNCFNDDYHKSTNHKHLTIEFISRPSILDKYSSVKNAEEKSEPKGPYNSDRF